MIVSLGRRMVAAIPDILLSRLEEEDREVQAQHLKIFYPSWAWSCTPLNSVLGKQRQAGLCTFEVIPVSIVSSRTSKGIQ